MTRGRQRETGALHLMALQQAQPWGQPYAPNNGWAWGSNGRLLNNLVVLATAAQLTGDAHFHDAVVMGVDYILAATLSARATWWDMARIAQRI